MYYRSWVYALEVFNFPWMHCLEVYSTVSSGLTGAQGGGVRRQSFLVLVWLVTSNEETSQRLFCLREVEFARACFLSQLTESGSAHTIVSGVVRLVTSNEEEGFRVLPWLIEQLGDVREGKNERCLLRLLFSSERHFTCCADPVGPLYEIVQFLAPWIPNGVFPHFQMTCGHYTIVRHQILHRVEIVLS